MEIEKTKKMIRRLVFTSKLLAIIFLICIFLLAINSGTCGSLSVQSLSCFGIDFTSLFFAGLFIFCLVISPIAAIAIGATVVIIAKNKKIQLEKSVVGLNIWSVLATAISSVVLLWMFSMNMCGARYKARDARRMSDLRQIAAAQETYHQKYSYYANSQQELVSDGIIEEALADPSTGDQYADADGTGIEGSDNDPQTWSVRVSLENGNNFPKEICRGSNSVQVQPPYRFCNEKGCQTVFQ
jgi:hypothetical protein